MANVFAMRNKATRRGPVNPMDKATIISIYPKLIHEKKNTIEPGVFTIEPGSYENPAILVVGPSSWWREIDAEQPLLEIPESALRIAESIVRDYCNGIVGCNMGSHMPGLFYLPGTLTIAEIKKNHKPLLDEYNEKQKAFYFNLVKMADTLWARSNGNPLSITDDARLAARSLGLNDKPWLRDYQSVQMIACVACGSLRNPLFPICSHCNRVIDAELASKLGIKVAV